MNTIESSRKTFRLLNDPLRSSRGLCKLQRWDYGLSLATVKLSERKSAWTWVWCVCVAFIVSCDTERAQILRSVATCLIYDDFDEIFHW